MVHGRDLDLAGGEILNGVIGAVVTLVHLFGFGAKGEAQHLVAEADAEDGLAAGDELLDFGHGVFARGGGVAGAIDKKMPSGFMARISEASAFAGTTVTSQPTLVRQRRILRLRP